MFFFLSKLLDIFLSPFTWGLIFLALAIPWRRPRHRPSRFRRRRAIGIAGLGLLLFFSTEPVANQMRYELEHATSATDRLDVTYDAVVLLGGLSDEKVAYEQGQPAYNEAVERLTATHRVLAEGHARFAILSAAPVDPARIDTSEPRVLARQLAYWGIDPSRVILEEQARNTRENAVYSERIARARGFEKVLIVTSAYHMRRSIECFEAIGMKVDTLLVDFRAHRINRFPALDAWLPRTGNLHDSSVVLHEFFGLYIYRMQGYAKPLPK